MECPICGSDDFDILNSKQKSSKKKITEEYLLKCVDCGHVFKNVVSSKKPQLYRVIISKQGESIKTFIELSPNDELIVGDSLLTEEGQVKITSIETENKRVKKALVEDIVTIWANSVEIPARIGFSVDLHGEVDSYKLDLDRDFQISTEDIVKIELARRVTVESIKHLSKNTNLIQDYNKETGDVRPSKILNINKEESFDTYENRFIYSLIKNMKFYIDRKKRNLITESSSKDDTKMEYNAKSSIGRENVDISMTIKSKKEEKKNSKESVDDVKMTEKDADAAKTAGAEDDGTQAQKENTDAENPKEASQSSESQSADGIDTKKKDAKDALIEELQDKVKRQMAEFDNFRKRTEKEKSTMFEMGASDIIKKLLPIVDNFDRGFKSVTDEELETPFAKGMDMVHKQLLKMLEDADVKPIEALGGEFNPDYHNAVMHVEDDSVGENIVVEEFEKGYTYRDQVIRHSMVKVAN